MFDRPLADFLPTTRREILAALQRDGEAWIGDLAHELHLSVSAVRQTLAGMEVDGLVRARHDRGSVGRPRLLFSLTADGTSLATRPAAFLADFANALLEATQAGPVKASTWAKALLEQHLADGRITAPPGPARLTQVIEIWREGGFAPQLCEGTDGPELVLPNCPLSRLAERHGLVCEAERAYFELALGYRVERVTHRGAGNAACVYRLHAREGVAAVPSAGA